MTIHIDPEFKRLIPPLKPEEYAQLEENILAEGCRDPLVLWKRGECDFALLDGHNRKAICEEHGVPCEYLEMEFPDRDAAMDWMDKNQIGRRNLTRDEFNLIVGRRYNRLKRQGARTDLTLGQNVTKLNTAETIAQAHKMTRHKAHHGVFTSQVGWLHGSKKQARTGEKNKLRQWLTTALCLWQDTSKEKM